MSVTTDTAACGMYACVYVGGVCHIHGGDSNSGGIHGIPLMAKLIEDLTLAGADNAAPTHPGVLPCVMGVCNGSRKRTALR